jgi:uncharacterized membrane protein required for colicin V production
MFDIMVLAVIAFLAFAGSFRGLFGQLFGFGGTIGGLVLATKYCTEVGPKLVPGFPPSIGYATAYLSIFFACALGASILGLMLGKAVNQTTLGTMNKIGGVLFGGAKGYCIAVAAAFLLIVFLPGKAGMLSTSKTIAYILPGADLTSKVAPEVVKKRYDHNKKTIGKTNDQQ